MLSHNTYREECEATSSGSTCGTPTGSSGNRDRKTVLVTGGAGFIGSHTSLALLKNGDDVIVIDEMNDYYDIEIKRSNLKLLKQTASSHTEDTAKISDMGPRAEADSEDSYSDSGSSTFSLNSSCSENDVSSSCGSSCSSTKSSKNSDNGRLVIVKGDISNLSLMTGLFTRYKPTHVCHLAARAGVRPSIDNPFVYVQSNVMGTVTLMELSAQHGVANFVYASSSSVYGGSEKEYFSENDVVDHPVSQYAATKKSTELFASTYNNLYGLNCTGLRFFTVYGPRGRPDMAPFKFMNRIYNGVTIDQYGDGTSERDYTYIDDIVAGVILSLDKPLGNEVLNLGRGSPCKLNKFIRTIEKLLNKDAVINYMDMQPGDVYRTCADTSKANKLLGYRAQVSLEEGLSRTVEWYREYVAN